MAEKKNVPQVRFNDFTEEWVPTEIENTFVDYIEKTVVQNQYPVLTSSQQKGIVLQQEYFADRQVTTNDNIGYFVLPRGYFTFRSRSDNDVFVFNRNDIVDKGIISYFYPVFNVTGADSNFFLRRVNHGIKHQLAIAAEGTGQHVLSLKKFKEIITLFPKEKEQQKIGELFEHMDMLIGDTQSKLEKLQNLRLSMLEKMFPKNDAEIPEMRFKGFVGVWSKTELCQIAYKVTEKNVQNLVSETFTNSAEHGVISQRDFFDHDISNSEKINGYYIVQDNDFVYNPRISVTAPCGPINRNRLGRKGVMSPLYTVFRTHDIDPLYLEWYFKSPHWYAYMRFNGDSGARSDRFSIKNELFFQMPIPLPDTREQHKVGQALQEISDYIKLQQKELNKLQSLKKGLLEKMFV